VKSNAGSGNSSGDDDCDCVTYLRAVEYLRRGGF
jgi:hypothetical protein